MKPLGSIPIGAANSFELLEGDESFAVYRKIYKDGRVTYIIAHLPPVQAYTEPPASALVEFSNESDAVRTFSRWKEDPLVIQLAPRHKKQAPDPRQNEFDLGRLESKGEIEFRSVLRQHEKWLRDLPKTEAHP
jgi:hypothetical protein